MDLYINAASHIMRNLTGHAGYIWAWKLLSLQFIWQSWVEIKPSIAYFSRVTAF